MELLFLRRRSLQKRQLALIMENLLERLDHHRTFYGTTIMSLFMQAM